MAGGQIQDITVGLHRPGEGQVVPPVRSVCNPEQAAARSRLPGVQKERGMALPHLAEHLCSGEEAQVGPGGAVLLIQLPHGLGNGLPVQVGVHAVNDLKGAPGHAVVPEGGGLLPLQRVPEGPGNQQTAPDAEEEGQQRQHGQGHLLVKPHCSTSSR